MLLNCSLQFVFERRQLFFSAVELFKNPIILGHPTSLTTHCILLVNELLPALVLGRVVVQASRRVITGPVSPASLYHCITALRNNVLELLNAIVLGSEFLGNSLPDLLTRLWHLGRRWR